MFGHGAHGPRIRRKFHNGQNGVANDIALASRKSVYDKTSGHHQGHALSLFPGIDKQKALPNTLYSVYQGVYGVSIAVAIRGISSMPWT